ncbi:glycosyltransferase family 4 protein [Nocardioides lijunqiniae]|uniref:glycosyltransferase family 4 protein n=1 Tax=Nocardioides lijunqiniae TaxID=2760832 RepID=UPI0030B85D03
MQGLRRRRASVQLHEVSYQGAPSILGRLWAMTKLQLKILPRLRSVDVVYVRWHFMSVLVVVASRLLNRPVVIEVNGNFDDAYVAWPTLRRVAVVVEASSRWQLRLATGTICVTEELATWVRQQGCRGALEVITNGADTERFRPGLNRSRLVGEDLDYVVFFGALSKWQGIPSIIESARDVHWPDGLHLVIAGDGADRDIVCAAAASLDHVHYLGSVDYSDVAPLVANAVASLIVKEGEFSTGLMPLKLFESLASGVPVIVTDYPGIANVVRSTDAGFVVAPGDVEAIVDAVTAVTRLPEAARAKGGRGRTWVVQGQSWDARAGQTLQLLQQLVTRPPV